MPAPNFGQKGLQSRLDCHDRAHEASKKRPSEGAARKLLSFVLFVCLYFSLCFFRTTTFDSILGIHNFGLKVCSQPLTQRALLLVRVRKAVGTHVHTLCMTYQAGFGGWQGAAGGRIVSGQGATRTRYNKLTPPCCFTLLSRCFTLQTPFADQVRAHSLATRTRAGPS